MQKHWLKRIGAPDLIVVALGWASEPRLVQNIPTEGYDVLVLYDYRTLEPLAAADTASYGQITLLAWSFGVWVAEQVCRDMSRAVRRLLDGEPLAYVLGEWEFYGLPLRVTPDVLIPRDDTCAVAELAIRKALFLEQDPRILDLCCGSGCIGLAIASRVKDAKVTLADLSMEALAIATGARIVPRFEELSSDKLGYASCGGRVGVA